MRILLDSNAYSGFMRGSHDVRDLILEAEEVLVSAVVVGEQLYGSAEGCALSRTLLNFDLSCNVHTYGNYKESYLSGRDPTVLAPEDAGGIPAPVGPKALIRTFLAALVSRSST